MSDQRSSLVSDPVPSSGTPQAALSLIANFLFIPYYPLWSILIVALDVTVIWALCVWNRDTA
jgi:hypothetical protein